MAQSQCSSTETLVCTSTLEANPAMAIRSKQYLAALKIWDRRSCFITGVPNEFLKVDTLSSNEAFGLFGKIQHLRIIHMQPEGDSPSEVFIKYASSAAAQRAIQWCLETGIAAKHGFQRYCSKLLCSKPCKRRNCPNLHSWASAEDIMDTDEIENFNPLRPKPKSQPPKSKSASQSNSQSKGKHSKGRRTRPKPKSGKSKSKPAIANPVQPDQSHQSLLTSQSHSDAVNVRQNNLNMPMEQQSAILQQQYDRLHQQCSQQSEFINKLMRQLDTLNEEHNELRQENSLLHQQSNSDRDLSLPSSTHSDDAMDAMGAMGAMDGIELDEMVDNMVEAMAGDLADIDCRDVEDNLGDQSGDSSGSNNRQSSRGPHYSGEDKGSDRSNSSNSSNRRQFQQYGSQRSNGSHSPEQSQRGSPEQSGSN